MSVVVVTGANRGIGLELVRQYSARGDNVIAACRSASPGLKALDVEIHDGVDVSDDASVRRFADALGDRQIDILVNNAGILTRETLEDLDFDRMRRQFEVNALGPIRVTKALLGHIRQGGKVAIVSSRVGSIAENAAGGNYGYRMSKTAVNMAGVNLSKDLNRVDIAVVLLHPGYVQTDMTGGSGDVTPAEAARGLIERIDETSLATTGTFWHAQGGQLPW